MKKLGLLIVATLALSSVAACKKKGAAEPDCAKAIHHSMELSKDEMKKMGNDDKMLQKMTDLGVQHCKYDKWPAAAVTCMIDAKTMPDSQACYGKLSQDQQDKMNKAAMELVMPAGAGSADGSASAGSAAAGSADGAGTASAGSSGSAAGSDAGSAAGSAAAGSVAGSGSAAATK